MSTEGTPASTPDPAAAGAGASDGSQKPTQTPQDEARSLHAKIGDLTSRLQKYEAADKAKADEEAKKRGEHEKLLTQRDEEIKALKPWQDKYYARVKTEHDRRMTTIDQCDEKIKAQFKQAEKGGELTLDDMERNLSKLEEYDALGLLTKNAGKDDTVVVPPPSPAQRPAVTPPPVQGPRACWQ